MLTMIFHSTFVHGAIAGWFGAAAVDFSAFRSWKSAQEAITYNWGLAAWRWLQGAVVGGVTALGYGAIA